MGDENSRPKVQNVLGDSSAVSIVCLLAVSSAWVNPARRCGFAESRNASFLPVRFAPRWEFATDRSGRQIYFIFAAAAALVCLSSDIQPTNVCLPVSMWLTSLSVQYSRN